MLRRRDSLVFALLEHAANSEVASINYAEGIEEGFAGGGLDDSAEANFLMAKMMNSVSSATGSFARGRAYSYAKRAVELGSEEALELADDILSSIVEEGIWTNSKTEKERDWLERLVSATTPGRAIAKATDSKSKEVESDMSRYWIVELQQVLRSLGYLVGTADGVFGPSHNRCSRRTKVETWAPFLE